MESLGRLARLVAVLAVAWTSAAGAADKPAKWRIDYDASQIVASARQMGSRVPAQFETFTGEIRFDRDRLDSSSLSFEIDVRSIRAANEDVETEAKSEDWFHAERYPKARFVSTDFEERSDGRYAVTGDLTIKGKTQPVTVPFTLSLDEDETGDGLVGSAKGEFTIQRLDFDVGLGEWGDTSVVSNDVTIRVEIVGRRPE